MTVESGYLGRREFHGALAKRSPYTQRPTVCVVCGKRYDNACEIAGELCHRCFLAGWRAVCAWCLATDCAIGVGDARDRKVAIGDSDAVIGFRPNEGRARDAA